MTNTPERIKLTKRSDIIPYIEKGYSLAYIGKHILKPSRNPDTMYRYVKRLREVGYVIVTHKGKRKLEI